MLHHCLSFLTERHKEKKRMHENAQLVSHHSASGCNVYFPNICLPILLLYRELSLIYFNGPYFSEYRRYLLYRNENARCSCTILLNINLFY